MVKWDDWIQCEEDTEMLIWEEWVEWVSSQNGREESQPKDQDGGCGDSQRECDLTDLPF
jgi:hypothetical protein